MRIRIWMLALVPFAMIGCADETPPVVTTTTTTTTQEVTTGAPTGAVVTREVVVPQSPPSVRIEARTIASSRVSKCNPATGDGPEGTTFGCLALGSDHPVPRLFGSQDIG